MIQKNTMTGFKNIINRRVECWVGMRLFRITGIVLEFSREISKTSACILVVVVEILVVDSLRIRAVEDLLDILTFLVAGRGKAFVDRPFVEQVVRTEDILVVAAVLHVAVVELASVLGRPGDSSCPVDHSWAAERIHEEDALALHLDSVQLAVASLKDDGGQLQDLEGGVPVDCEDAEVVERGVAGFEELFGC